MLPKWAVPDHGADDHSGSTRCLAVGPCLSNMFSRPRRGRACVQIWRSGMRFQRSALSGKSENMLVTLGKPTQYAWPLGLWIERIQQKDRVCLGAVCQLLERRRSKVKAEAFGRSDQYRCGTAAKVSQVCLKLFIFGLLIDVERERTLAVFETLPSRDSHTRLGCCWSATGGVTILSNRCSRRSFWRGCLARGHSLGCPGDGSAQGGASLEACL